MTIDLTNKNILVTGAAGIGVGSGICEAIAACGGNLIINDLCENQIESAVNRYKNAIGLQGDVSKPKEVHRIFAELKEKCGSIHGLVNNAGVGMRKNAHEATEAEYDRIFDIDVKGVWLMSRSFAYQLNEFGEKGHIVNVSSVHASMTIPRYAIYSSAKAAVEGLTRGMAVEMGRVGVRCNAVAPGYVDSVQNREAVASWTDQPQEWIDSHKHDYQNIPDIVSARDCGNAVAFLLSDLSRSISGQTLTVDGGLTNLLYANSFIP